jgi:hypothetical protein
MRKASFFYLISLLASILFVVRAPGTTTNSKSSSQPFTFVSMGDGQANAALITTTANQIASLNPAIVIFNGDLEISGVISTEIDPMISAIKNAGLYDKTFLVRGNHDNVMGGSAGLWESYFETSPNIKVLPAGVSEYVSLDSNSDYLNYSFIYGNAMFIGLDVPGDIWYALTSAELTFLDARLAYAESIGLVHAFIYFHGPLYCVEGMHCTCSTRTDANCTPANLVTILNRHPIVSATFHGHEHILGWTHMDGSRVAGLTGSFEQFITSPSGGTTYNGLLFPARMDYTYMDMGASQGFAVVTVNGDAFTFSIYKVGTTAPVWSHTFNLVCYALTLSHSGNGSPPIADPVKSDACPVNGEYVAGQLINLSGAAPDSGWQIASWTGTSNDASMVGTNTLTMPASNASVAINYGKFTIGSWTSIFQGIDQADAQTTIVSGSGNQVIHALRIDLQNPDIHLFTTPAISTNYQPDLRETAGSTTSEFLLQYNLQAAINANFFSPCCSQPSGSPFDAFGLAISQGNLVSAQEDANYAASMVLTSNNIPTMISMNWPAVDTSGIFTAVSGKYPLVVHGSNVAADGPVHPRTAIGYSEDGRYLILMTIDGRQPIYSDGAVDLNTAEWMIRLGAYEAINLDGGGSTTMVISDGHGGAQVLNRPIHNNIPGTQRVVANHLGIYVNPLHVYTLTINKVGNGTVMLVPAAPYHLGDVVHLTANADLDWTFTGWSDPDCPGTGTCTLTMYANKTITATFTYNPTSVPFTISGNAGVGGATISYTGSSNGSTTANSSGLYSFTVDFGWVGTVTPSRAGYTFSPAYKPYVNVMYNQANQNYTATALTNYSVCLPLIIW